MEQAKFVDKYMCKYNLQIPVYIEVNSDGKRAGVNPGDPLLLALGKEIHQNKGTALRGVLTHAGASYTAFTKEDMLAVSNLERDNTVMCAELLRKNGFPCPEVSIGSTPTALLGQDFTGITEIRAGVYMLISFHF